jgi:cell division protein FtsX
MISPQLSARSAAIAAMVFAAICLWLAIDAFTSSPGQTNPDQLSGGADFALIWALLTAVGVAIGWFSWRQGTR